MEMNPWERRQRILEVLCLRRHDTYGNLAHEFNVSTGTFHLDRRSLNSAEITFLRRLGESLDGSDLEMLNRIIATFSH